MHNINHYLTRKIILERDERFMPRFLEHDVLALFIYLVS